MQNILKIFLQLINKKTNNHIFLNEQKMQKTLNTYKHTDIHRHTDTR